MRTCRSSRFCGTAILAVALLFVCAGVAGAYNFPYDYVLEENRPVPIPRTYDSVRVISYLGAEIGQMKDPQDLFIHHDGTLYIADTGNNRIIRMSAAGDVLAVFNGDEQGLSRPSGVFVDRYGDMFIADTRNRRILHLSPEGEFVEEFLRPESEMLGAEFAWEPTKIALSPTGLLYTIRSKTVMVIDASGQFRGYRGQTDIGFSLTRWIVRMFASEEQRERVASAEAASYTNLVVDDLGFIYATSLDDRYGRIKKLNSVGENIYPERFYGEFDIDPAGRAVRPQFVDLAVDEHGIVTALEAIQRKVYQYDREGNLLTIFGGQGEKRRLFQSPTSIAQDAEGRLYVLDGGSVKVFEPTRFIRLVHEAVRLYGDGRYEDAYRVWSDVLRIDENYELAGRGLAKTLQKRELYAEATNRYQIAGDRVGYSRSFVEFRHEWFRSNFVLTVAAIALIGGSVGWGLISWRGGSARLADAIGRRSLSDPSRLDMAALPATVVFHPADTFRLIKRHRTMLAYWPAVAILVLLVVVRIGYIFLVHFPLSELEPRDANVVLEIVRMLLPILTWIVATYGVTTIMDGEAVFGEVFVAGAYAMVPYLVFAIPIALLSRVLSIEEAGIYNFVNVAVWVWIVGLVVLSVYVLHQYSFGKTIVVTVVSALAMLLIWAIAILLYALTTNLWVFLSGIVLEIYMLFV